MIRFARKQWFLLGLVVVLGAAMAAPEIGRTGGPLAPEKWQGLLVAGIFLLGGIELRTSELGGAIRDVRLHVFVQGVSLGLSPLLFYAVARGLAWTDLPAPLLEGFVVLGCLPTTVTSGVAFTRASGGDEAGALFNATIGNLLGIVVTPLSILLYTGHHASVPAGAVATQLAWQVAAPIALGQVLQIWIGRWATRWRPWLGRTSVLLLLVLIYFVFSGSFARGFGVSTGYVAVAVVLCVALHGALVAIAFRLSAMKVWAFSRAKRTSAVICSTQKTAALGLPLLAILYREEASLGLLAMPLLIYHPLQLLVAGSAVDAWRRYNGAPIAPDPTAPESAAR
jgi:sodium/bile acid cotransporter 7